MPSICWWCEMKLPKKPYILGNAIFCNEKCYIDSIENRWPSWMTGRIGPEPNRNFHQTGSFLCLSAPNRYRQAYRKSDPEKSDNKVIIEMQNKDFPELKNPSGIDIDFPSFDQVLIWENQSLKDVL